MKNLVFFFLLLIPLTLASQIELSNNIGDDVKFKNMFSCYQTEWWARDFILKDFGILESQEFIIKSGKFAINYSYEGASYQFNFYEIDENFPNSFNENNLVGSSKISPIPYAGSVAKIVEKTFETPVIIPANVKRILVEVKKTVTPNNPSISIATIAGTDEGVKKSWYKGCINIGNGTGYQSTEDFGGLYPGNPEAHFYITVNGEAKTILPFEILSSNPNCYGTNSNFNLSNSTNIKSVIWDFDDPKSFNNSSTKIEVTHLFSSPGIYNVKAVVTHINGEKFTIDKKIEVLETPIVNSMVNLKQCDNVDINGFTNFNLNEAKPKIILNPENYTITFFEEKTLAENNINPISNISAYTNQTISNDSVWARVENSDGCFRLSKVSLIVTTTQIPATFSKVFYKCDDGIDTEDGIATFDFSSATQEIKDLFPTNQQLIIKYYRNETDALSEFNEITDITNYQNTGSPNKQDIYVRVDSELNNDCLGLGHYITLDVEKKPIANAVTINPECDNDRDGIFDFDTSSIQNTIIGNQTDVTVSYFDEKNNPLPSPLPNPFSTTTQTIKARIINTLSKDLNGQCYDETTIDFIVNSVPVINPISIQEQCDDDFDGIASFDTSSIENTILGTQTGMIVKYFDSNNIPLPSPLPNPFTTSTQTIKVRIENPQYTSCFDEATIDFIVREKPNFHLDSETIFCTNSATPLEIRVKNPNGNYSYEWKDVEGTSISNSINLKISKGGIYFVKATTEFGCESEVKSIQISESNIANITINNLEVTDDSDNNSIRINTQNIGLGNYEFSLLDSDLNVIYDYQETPFFDNLKGGLYTVLVNDINGCGMLSFETSIISYPKFFTPNNDGINDTWHILGIDKSFYTNGKILIFNRYGKLIKKLAIDERGWDGLYQGTQLPSNDYWFKAELVDPKGNIIQKKGNFSLLRK